MSKSEEIQTVKVEIVGPEQPPRLNPADVIQQMVQREVTKILANREEFMFRPFFDERRISNEISRMQTVGEQRKWEFYFKKFGCLLCGAKEKNHQSCGMCQTCYPRTSQRLKAIVRNFKPQREDFDCGQRDEEAIARQALTGIPKALPPKPEGRRTQEQAVKEAGISRWTLLRWIKEGKVERPKERMSEKLWLWGDEDIERLRGLKVTNTPGRPKTLNIDAAQAAQLRAEGKSLTEIGQILGCSRETARRAFKEVKSK